MATLLFGTILPWLLVALVGWLFYQVLRQNGRILRRLEALEEQVSQSSAPKGLDPGTPAPNFELPDLSGQLTSLEHWRGRRLLLVFFNPECGFCAEMAPSLAALKPDSSYGRPLPVLITRGSPEENRRFMDEQGIHCPVLLQGKSKVSSHYQVEGTPMGYLIDEEGIIVSPLTVGADALLELAVLPAAPAAEGAPEEHAGQGPHASSHKGKANRGLQASRLTRDGLKVGTPAPPFRLPKLDGGELALENYRGRKVLLVFSDPDCGPCTLLAPALEEFHRDQPGVQVLMISRRDADANRKKAAELGLTFPVALQKHWEVSLLYGMFSTPIASLIDEQGVLATDVVVGEAAIKELMRAASQRPAQSLPQGNGVVAETAS